MKQGKAVFESAVFPRLVTRRTGGYEEPPAPLPQARRKRRTSVRVPTLKGIETRFQPRDLSASHLFREDQSITAYGKRVLSYFQARSESLQDVGDNQLMDAEEAKGEYDRMCAQFPSVISPQPMNKQKGAMKAPAFLTPDSHGGSAENPISAGSTTCFTWDLLTKFSVVVK